MIADVSEELTATILRVEDMVSKQIVRSKQEDSRIAMMLSVHEHLESLIIFHGSG
jgi:hypothetical protein